MKSKGKVFAVVAFAFALCLALAGCGGSSGADKSADYKKAVVGTWELTEITGASEDDMAMMKAFGLTVEMAFAEDGTFKMGIIGETIDGTWEAPSADKVTMKAEGDTIEATIKDGVLAVEIDGESMKFKKSTDEVKDLTAAASSSGDVDLTADKETVALDREVVSDDTLSIKIVNKKQDWMDDCGYTLVITNKTADTPIDVAAAYGTWVVNGKMSDPFFYETIQPGAYVETFMSFTDDSIKCIDDLKSVKGSFEVANSSTYDSIETIPVELP